MLNRRDFIKATGAGLATAALGSNAFPQSPEKRPNILIIMADDMGYSDIGCYGGEVQTPNLDRLAGNGLRFRQFYNAARCCPTRASLLTGLYPHQAGMGGMVSRIQNDVEGPYQGYLNDQCVTIAEALRPAGYRTYMSGKWHVGERRPCWPCDRGFEKYFGLISGASSYYELVEEERTMALGNEKWTPPEEGFYMTDAFTDFAVECIRDHDQKDPFFLYLAFTAPHWPLHAPKDVIEKYRGRYDGGWDKLRDERYARMCDMGITQRRYPLSPRDEDVPPWNEREDDTDWPALMETYTAMIDRMDQGIGRVLDTLEERGELENTLILFCSDNGACHEGLENKKQHTPGTKPGERGSFLAYRRPWANASNTPFRLFKHWVHEGGISTPLIAHWPAGLKEKGFTDAVGHVMDFMPTCLEVAGAEYPREVKGEAITPLPGQSLLPVLRGKRSQDDRTLFWEHQGNNAIREGNWKLVSREGDARWELYNLADDRTELYDKSGVDPKRAQAMKERYLAWADEVGAHMDKD
ncbi:MAG: arylsulfatase [Candidatus Hydrogenedentes bacterium]|nr:arylsulfatase [Candidatus Hydrogenedentota bacterium]